MGNTTSPARILPIRTVLKRTHLITERKSQEKRRKMIERRCLQLLIRKRPISDQNDPQDIIALERKLMSDQEIDMCDLIDHFAGTRTLPSGEGTDHPEDQWRLHEYIAIDHQWAVHHQQDLAEDEDRLMRHNSLLSKYEYDRGLITIKSSITFYHLNFTIKI